ncbi:MAG: HAMP domain-containing protein, partial [Verrucomicrobiales bacterium]|nr:HAMP domain-containing protein [Verrucomicrobiales bacterium]
MLKNRLILILLGILLMTGAICSLGIFLLQRTVDEFHRVVNRDFEAIRAINNIRGLSARLESQYLFEIAEEEPPQNLDDAAFQLIESELLAVQEMLVKSTGQEPFTEAEKAALNKMNASLDNYLDAYEPVFENEFADLSRAERTGVRRDILRASFGLAEVVQEALDVFERTAAGQSVIADRRARSAIAMMWGVAIVAGLCVFAIYRVFSNRIMSPLDSLTTSIRKVKQQDFDHVMKVKSTDEIGQVAEAFNDMSAELRVMKLESDQEMIKLNRERRAIISGFPHPIYILDTEGEITQQNPAAERLSEKLGLENQLPGKIRGRMQAYMEDDEDYLPDDISFSMLLRIDEREFWYLPRIFRIRTDLEKEPTGWAVVLIEVTRVRWLDDLTYDLIGTVSHEVRTPLTSIRMILLLLSEQKIGELNERQEKMVSSARDDCERMLET